MGETERRAGWSSSTRLAATLDGATDGALLAFAAWTLYYEVALWARWSVIPGAAVWSGLAMLCVALGAARALSSQRGAAEVRLAVVPALALPGWALTLALALTLGLVFLIRPVYGLGPVAVGLALVLLLLFALSRSTRAEAHFPPVHEPRVVADLAVVVVAVVAAWLALHLLKPDADDAFFVNRSVWVASHGVPSLRDTLYGSETLPLSYSGGLPLSSIESLLGALAKLSGLQAGTVTYLVALPALAFAAVWITWRLSRAWAPSRALVVFAVAVIYVVMCAESTVGSYSIGRLWQGKAMAFALLTPLIWAYVAEIQQRRDPFYVVLLLSAGIAFVGLTSTATLQAPMIALPVLLVALLRRDTRVAMAGVALLAAPTVSGLIVLSQVAGTAGGSVAGGAAPISLDLSFAYLAGVKPAMVVLTLAALVMGPFLVRRFSADVVALAVLGTFFMLIPGAFAAANAVTGAGPVLWRMLLGVPLWVLVGVLVTSVPSRSGRVLRGRVGTALITTAIVGVLVAVGTPLWSSEVGARLTSRPTWKIDPLALSQARAVASLETRAGPWLLPPLAMEAMPIITAQHFALVPRALYLPGPEVRLGDQDARVLLYRVAATNGSGPLPASTEQIRHALDHLDVSLFCAASSDGQLRSVLRQLAAPLHAAGPLRCVALDGEARRVSWPRVESGHGPGVQRAAVTFLS